MHESCHGNGPPLNGCFLAYPIPIPNAQVWQGTPPRGRTELETSFRPRRADDREKRGHLDYHTRIVPFARMTFPISGSCLVHVTLRHQLTCLSVQEANPNSFGDPVWRTPEPSAAMTTAQSCPLRMPVQPWPRELPEDEDDDPTARSCLMPAIHAVFPIPATSVSSREIEVWLLSGFSPQLHSVTARRCTAGRSIQRTPFCLPLAQPLWLPRPGTLSLPRASSSCTRSSGPYTLKLEPVQPPADSLPHLPGRKGVHHRQLPRARQGSPRLLRSPGRRDQPTPTSRPLLEAPKPPRTQQAQGRARVSVQRSRDLKLKAQSSASAPPPTPPPNPEQGGCVLPCLPPVPSTRP